jgi:hypothetical protein
MILKNGKAEAIPACWIHRTRDSPQVKQACSRHSKSAIFRRTAASAARGTGDPAFRVTMRFFSCYKIIHGGKGAEKDIVVFQEVLYEVHF